MKRTLRNILPRHLTTVDVYSERFHFSSLTEVISLASVSERSSLCIFSLGLAVLLGAEDDEITTVILSITEVNETRLSQLAK